MAAASPVSVSVGAPTSSQGTCGASCLGSGACSYGLTSACAQVLFPRPIARDVNRGTPLHYGGGSSAEISVRLSYGPTLAEDTVLSGAIAGVAASAVEYDTSPPSPSAPTQADVTAAEANLEDIVRRAVRTDMMPRQRITIHVSVQQDDGEQGRWFAAAANAASAALVHAGIPLRACFAVGAARDDNLHAACAVAHLPHDDAPSAANDKPRVLYSEMRAAQPVTHDRFRALRADAYADATKSLLSVEEAATRMVKRVTGLLDA